MDRINSLEKEIANIRKILHEKEKELYALKKEWCPVQLKTNGQLSQVPSDSFNHHIGNNGHVQCDRLPKWAIERYSRQILLPDIGVSGQEKLCAAKVLIVGAGGLGCPAAMYLAGAGVGEIGIVDYDTVDLTNIHRQTLHGESDQNMNKVDSAADALRSINSKITITPYKVQLDSTNALAIASKYDILLDCTDNVPTRYMLSDVSVLTKLPLVSGSALKMEGQISLFGYRAERNSKVENTTYIGPCYRCVFPTPPPAEAVGSCSANGVAGPVPGVVGALQALEAIKYIVGQSRHKLLVERMVLFDGEDMTFRTVKLRPQNPECAACSKTPTITHLLDYETFCKAQAKEKDLDLQILPSHHRITPTELSSQLNRFKLTTDSSRPTPHLLVDVRSAEEFHMCRIDGAVNFPEANLRGERLDALLAKIRQCASQVVFICRRGNDSQIAAKRVLDVIETEHRGRISDLTGGLHGWSKDVDNDFPVY